MPIITEYAVLTVSSVEVHDEWFLPFVIIKGKGEEHLHWMHLKPPHTIEKGAELICAFGGEKGVIVAAAIIRKWREGDFPSIIKLLPGYPETILLRDVRSLV